jgi:ankyrin repeat protein
MPQRVKEFHYAVMRNDREIVRHMVSDGVNINFPWYNPSNPSVKDGSTPLIIAVSLNYTEIVDVRLSPPRVPNFLYVSRLGSATSWSLHQQV